MERQQEKKGLRAYLRAFRILAAARGASIL